MSLVLAIGSFSKPRLRRQRELRRQTKGLMSKTLVVPLHFESFYISLRSSAKKQREMTVAYILENLYCNGHFFVSSSFIVRCPEQVFKPTGVLNRSKQLRHLRVKYKLFLKVVVLGFAFVIAKNSLMVSQQRGSL